MKNHLFRNSHSIKVYTEKRKTQHKDIKYGYLGVKLKSWDNSNNPGESSKNKTPIRNINEATSHNILK